MDSLRICLEKNFVFKLMKQQQQTREIQKGLIITRHVTSTIRFVKGEGFSGHLGLISIKETTLDSILTVRHVLSGKCRQAGEFPFHDPHTNITLSMKP